MPQKQYGSGQGGQKSGSYRSGEKKGGYPTFKKKGRTRDSFYVACDKLQVQPWYVRLPVIGSIRLSETPRFSGKILSAVVSRTADQWFISIQVDVGETYQRTRSGNASVGIDLGITTFATLSTGEKVLGPKALTNTLKLLKKRSKQHSRKLKGSQNRRKATEKLAKLHARVANLRNDFLHKLSHRLCCENQAVGIEDLNVKGMLRNRRLSRALNDASFSEFRRQLTYKAELFGTEILLAARWFPSSKLCSSCGTKAPSLPLNIREWVCSACGTAHDRDINAAINLLPTNQLPRASREVTPVEMGALSGDLSLVKLPSVKQELCRA
jgi:putative transposase